MRAYYCDHFVLPLPEGHRFPMEKYRLLRERVAAAAIAVLHVPEACLGHVEHSDSRRRHAFAKQPVLLHREAMSLRQRQHEVVTVVSSHVSPTR